MNLEKLYKIEERMITDGMFGKTKADCMLSSEVFSPGIVRIHNVADKVFETFNAMARANKVSLQKEIPENTSVYVEERMLISIL